MGVKIIFITDGDVSGVISVAYPNKNIDIYLGIGGGPEGVLAAAALKCLGCQMQTRLFFQDSELDAIYPNNVYEELQVPVYPTGPENFDYNVESVLNNLNLYYVYLYSFY